MPRDGLNIVVVGLSFGRSYINGFAHHPDVATVGVCDLNDAVLSEVAEQFPVGHRYDSLDAVLADERVDAVALFTPIPDHARHVLQVFQAGKHCACTVPMATNPDDLQAIIDAQRASGMVYMMMETSCATAEFFFVREIHQRGEFGQIQFMHGVFQNNLENHPGYWMGLPPMHYTTHPLSPLLALAGTRATRVCCIGSGTMRDELQQNYGNPWPIQTAIFQLHDHPAAMQIDSITIETAVQSKETFDIYGSQQSFQWATFHEDTHALVRLHEAIPGGAKSSPRTVFRMRVPSADDRLPASVRRVNQRRPQGHLAHEFVRSIVEHRQPWIDAVTAANWTAPGLCAHQAALSGEPVRIPAFA
jgi:predicted dehydrogenase